MKKLNRISHLFYDSNDLGSRFDFLTFRLCLKFSSFCRWETWLLRLDITRWYVTILVLKRSSNFRKPLYGKAIMSIELISTGSLLNWLWMRQKRCLSHGQEPYKTKLKASQLGLLLYNTRRLKDIYHDPYMCQNYAYRQAYHTIWTIGYSGWAL